MTWFDFGRRKSGYYHIEYAMFESSALVGSITSKTSLGFCREGIKKEVRCGHVPMRGCMIERTDTDCSSTHVTTSLSTEVRVAH